MSKDNKMKYDNRKVDDLSQSDAKFFKASQRKNLKQLIIILSAFLVMIGLVISFVIIFNQSKQQVIANPLKTPENVQIQKTQEQNKDVYYLSFDAVKNADYYAIYLFESEDEVKAQVEQNYRNAVPFMSTTKTVIDVSMQIEDIGEYYFAVQAIYRKVASYSSLLSDPYDSKVTIYYDLTNPTLIINSTKNKIDCYWTSVLNAFKYNVYYELDIIYNKTGLSVLDEPIKVVGNTYSTSQSVFDKMNEYAENEFTIKVRSISDNKFVKSLTDESGLVWSEEKAYTYKTIEKPEIKTYSFVGGTYSVSWDELNFADGYYVFVNGNLVSTITSKTESNYEFTPENYGTYNICVQAYSNSKYVQDSERSDVVNLAEYRGATNPITGISATRQTVFETECIKLSWIGDANKTYYYIYIQSENEEEYVDANGNGKYDYGEEFVDKNGNGVYDSGYLTKPGAQQEEYVDANGNGKYDYGEEFTDLNSNGIYDNGNPYYDVVDSITTYSFPMSINANGYYKVSIKSLRQNEYFDESISSDSYLIRFDKRYYNSDALGIIYGLPKLEKPSIEFDQVNTKLVYHGNNGKATHLTPEEAKSLCLLAPFASDNNGFEIKFYEGNNALGTLLETVNISKTSLELSNYNYSLISFLQTYGAGKYYVTIRALGGYLIFDNSEVDSVILDYSVDLPAPQNVQIYEEASQVILSFDIVKILDENLDVVEQANRYYIYQVGEDEPQIVIIYDELTGTYTSTSGYSVTKDGDTLKVGGLSNYFEDKDPKVYSFYIIADDVLSNLYNTSNPSITVSYELQKSVAKPVLSHTSQLDVNGNETNYYYVYWKYTQDNTNNSAKKLFKDGQTFDVYVNGTKVLSNLLGIEHVLKYNNTTSGVEYYYGYELSQFVLPGENSVQIRANSLGNYLASISDIKVFKDIPISGTDDIIKQAYYYYIEKAYPKDSKFVVTGNKDGDVISYNIKFYSEKYANSFKVWFDPILAHQDYTYEQDQNRDDAYANTFNIYLNGSTNKDTNILVNDDLFADNDRTRVHFEISFDGLLSSKNNNITSERANYIKTYSSFVDFEDKFHLETVHDFDYDVFSNTLSFSYKTNQLSNVQTFIIYYKYGEDGNVSTVVLSRQECEENYWVGNTTIGTSTYSNFEYNFNPNNVGTLYLKVVPTSSGAVLRETTEYKIYYTSIKLNAPQNLTINDGRVSWDAVLNASIYGGGGDVYPYTVKVCVYNELTGDFYDYGTFEYLGKSFDLFEQFPVLKTAKNKIKVCVMANGHTYASRKFANLVDYVGYFVLKDGIYVKVTDENKETLGIDANVTDAYYLQYNSSDWAESNIYDYVPQLLAPSVRLSGDVLTVEKAEQTYILGLKYEVYVEGENEPFYVDENNSTSQFAVNLRTHLVENKQLGAGKYNIYVKSKHEEWGVSSSSSVLVEYLIFEQLSQIQILTDDDDLPTYSTPKSVQVTFKNTNDLDKLKGFMLYFEKQSLSSYVLGYTICIVKNLDNSFSAEIIETGHLWADKRPVESTDNCEITIDYDSLTNTFVVIYESLGADIFEGGKSYVVYALNVCEDYYNSPYTSSASFGCFASTFVAPTIFVNQENNFYVGTNKTTEDVKILIKKQENTRTVDIVIKNLLNSELGEFRFNKVELSRLELNGAYYYFSLTEYYGNHITNLYEIFNSYLGIYQIKVRYNTNNFIIASDYSSPAYIYYSYQGVGAISVLAEPKISSLPLSLDIEIPNEVYSNVDGSTFESFCVVMTPVNSQNEPVIIDQINGQNETIMTLTEDDNSQIVSKRGTFVNKYLKSKTVNSQTNTTTYSFSIPINTIGGFGNSWSILDWNYRIDVSINYTLATDLSSKINGIKPVYEVDQKNIKKTEFSKFKNNENAIIGKYYYDETRNEYLQLDASNLVQDGDDIIVVVDKSTTSGETDYYSLVDEDFVYEISFKSVYASYSAFSNTYEGKYYKKESVYKMIYSLQGLYDGIGNLTGVNLYDRKSQQIDSIDVLGQPNQTILSDLYNSYQFTEQSSTQSFDLTTSATTKNLSSLSINEEGYVSWNGNSKTTYYYVYYVWNTKDSSNNNSAKIIFNDDELLGYYDLEGFSPTYYEGVMSLDFDLATIGKRYYDITNSIVYAQPNALSETYSFISIISELGEEGKHFYYKIGETFVEILISGVDRNLFILNSRCYLRYVDENYQQILQDDVNAQNSNWEQKWFKTVGSDKGKTGFRIANYDSNLVYGVLIYSKQTGAGASAVLHQNFVPSFSYEISEVNIISDDENGYNYYLEFDGIDFLNNSVVFNNEIKANLYNSIVVVKSGNVVTDDNRYTILDTDILGVDVKKLLNNIENTNASYSISISTKDFVLELNGKQFVVIPKVSIQVQKSAPIVVNENVGLKFFGMVGTSEDDLGLVSYGVKFKKVDYATKYKIVITEVGKTAENFKQDPIAELELSVGDLGLVLEEGVYTYDLTSFFDGISLLQPRTNYYIWIYVAKDLNSGIQSTELATGNHVSTGEYYLSYDLFETFKQADIVTDIVCDFSSESYKSISFKTGKIEFENSIYKVQILNSVGEFIDVNSGSIESYYWQEISGQTIGFAKTFESSVLDGNVYTATIDITEVMNSHPAGNYVVCITVVPVVESSKLTLSRTANSEKIPNNRKLYLENRQYIKMVVDSYISTITNGEPVYNSLDITKVYEYFESGKIFNNKQILNQVQFSVNNITNWVSGLTTNFGTVGASLEIAFKKNGTICKIENSEWNSLATLLTFGSQELSVLTSGEYQILARVRTSYDNGIYFAQVGAEANIATEEVEIYSSYNIYNRHMISRQDNTLEVIYSEDGSQINDVLLSTGINEIGANYEIYCYDEDNVLIWYLKNYVDGENINYIRSYNGQTDEVVWTSQSGRKLEQTLSNQTISIFEFVLANNELMTYGKYCFKVKWISNQSDLNSNLLNSDLEETTGVIFRFVVGQTISSDLTSNKSISEQNGVWKFGDFSDGTTYVTEYNLNTVLSKPQINTTIVYQVVSTEGKTGRTQTHTAYVQVEILSFEYQTDRWSIVYSYSLKSESDAHFLLDGNVLKFNLLDDVYASGYIVGTYTFYSNLTELKNHLTNEKIDSVSGKSVRLIAVYSDLYATKEDKIFLDETNSILTNNGEARNLYLTDLLFDNDESSDSFGLLSWSFSDNTRLNQTDSVTIVLKDEFDNIIFEKSLLITELQAVNLKNILLADNDPYHNFNNIEIYIKTKNDLWKTPAPFTNSDISLTLGGSFNEQSFVWTPQITDGGIVSRSQWVDSDENNEINVISFDLKFNEYYSKDTRLQDVTTPYLKLEVISVDYADYTSTDLGFLDENGNLKLTFDEIKDYNIGKDVSEQANLVYMSYSQSEWESCLDLAEFALKLTSEGGTQKVSTRTENYDFSLNKMLKYLDDPTNQIWFKTNYLRYRALFKQNSDYYGYYVKTNLGEYVQINETNFNSLGIDQNTEIFRQTDQMTPGQYFVRISLTDQSASGYKDGFIFESSMHVLDVWRVEDLSFVTENFDVEVKLNNNTTEIKHIEGKVNNNLLIYGNQALDSITEEQKLSWANNNKDVFITFRVKTTGTKKPHESGLKIIHYYANTFTSEDEPIWTNNSSAGGETLAVGEDDWVGLDTENYHVYVVSVKNIIDQYNNQYGLHKFRVIVKSYQGQAYESDENTLAMTDGQAFINYVKLESPTLEYVQNKPDAVNQNGSLTITAKFTFYNHVLGIEAEGKTLKVGIRVYQNPNDEDYVDNLDYCYGQTEPISNNRQYQVVWENIPYQSSAIAAFEQLKKNVPIYFDCYTYVNNLNIFLINSDRAVVLNEIVDGYEAPKYFNLAKSIQEYKTSSYYNKLIAEDDNFDLVKEENDYYFMNLIVDEEDAGRFVTEEISYIDEQTNQVVSKPAYEYYKLDGVTEENAFNYHYMIVMIINTELTQTYYYIIWYDVNSSYDVINGVAQNTKHAALKIRQIELVEFKDETVEDVFYVELTKVPEDVEGRKYYKYNSENSAYDMFENFSQVMQAYQNGAKIFVQDPDRQKKYMLKEYIELTKEEKQIAANLNYKNYYIWWNDNYLEISDNRTIIENAGIDLSKIEIFSKQSQISHKTYTLSVNSDLSNSTEDDFKITTNLYRGCYYLGLKDGKIIRRVVVEQFGIPLKNILDQTRFNSPQKIEFRAKLFNELSYNITNSSKFKDSYLNHFVKLENPTVDEISFGLVDGSDLLTDGNGVAYLDEATIDKMQITIKLSNIKNTTEFNLLYEIKRNNVIVARNVIKLDGYITFSDLTNGKITYTLRYYEINNDDPIEEIRRNLPGEISFKIQAVNREFESNFLRYGYRSDVSEMMKNNIKRLPEDLDANESLDIFCYPKVNALNGEAKYINSDVLKECGISQRINKKLYQIKTSELSLIQAKNNILVNDNMAEPTYKGTNLVEIFDGDYSRGCYNVEKQFMLLLDDGYIAGLGLEKNWTKVEVTFKIEGLSPITLVYVENTDQNGFGPIIDKSALATVSSQNNYNGNENLYSYLASKIDSDCDVRVTLKVVYPNKNEYADEKHFDGYWLDSEEQTIFFHFYKSPEISNQKVGTMTYLDEETVKLKNNQTFKSGYLKPDSLNMSWNTTNITSLLGTGYRVEISGNGQYTFHESTSANSNSFDLIRDAKILNSDKTESANQFLYGSTLNDAWTLGGKWTFKVTPYYVSTSAYKIYGTTSAIDYTLSLKLSNLRDISLDYVIDETFKTNWEGIEDITQASEAIRAKARKDPYYSADGYNKIYNSSAIGVVGLRGLEMAGASSANPYYENSDSFTYYDKNTNYTTSFASTGDGTNYVSKWEIEVSGNGINKRQTVYVGSSGLDPYNRKPFNASNIVQVLNYMMVDQKGGEYTIRYKLYRLDTENSYALDSEWSQGYRFIYRKVFSDTDDFSIEQTGSSSNYGNNVKVETIQQSDESLYTQYEFNSNLKVDVKLEQKAVSISLLGGISAPSDVYLSSLGNFAYGTNKSYDIYANRLDALNYTGNLHNKANTFVNYLVEGRFIDKTKYNGKGAIQLGKNNFQIEVGSDKYNLGFKFKILNVDVCLPESFKIAINDPTYNLGAYYASNEAKQIIKYDNIEKSEYLCGYNSIAQNFNDIRENFTRETTLDIVTVDVYEKIMVKYAFYIKDVSYKVNNRYNYAATFSMDNKYEFKNKSDEKGDVIKLDSEKKVETKADAENLNNFSPTLTLMSPFDGTEFTNTYGLPNMITCEKLLKSNSTDTVTLSNGDVVTENKEYEFKPTVSKFKTGCIASYTIRAEAVGTMDHDVLKTVVGIWGGISSYLPSKHLYGGLILKITKKDVDNYNFEVTAKAQAEAGWTGQYEIKVPFTDIGTSYDVFGYIAAGELSVTARIDGIVGKTEDVQSAEGSDELEALAWNEQWGSRCAITNVKLEANTSYENNYKKDCGFSKAEKNVIKVK